MNFSDFILVPYNENMQRPCFLKKQHSDAIDFAKAGSLLKQLLNK